MNEDYSSYRIIHVCWIRYHQPMLEQCLKYSLIICASYLDWSCLYHKQSLIYTREKCSVLQRMRSQQHPVGPVSHQSNFIEVSTPINYSNIGVYNNAHTNRRQLLTTCRAGHLHMMLLTFACVIYRATTMTFTHLVSSSTSMIQSRM